LSPRAWLAGLNALAENLLKFWPPLPTVSDGGYGAKTSSCAFASFWPLNKSSKGLLQCH
jgi:hypothetical protein